MFSLLIIGGAVIPEVLTAGGPDSIIGKIMAFTLLVIGVVAVLVIVSRSNEDNV